MSQKQWIFIAAGASATALIAFLAIRGLRRKPRRILVAVDFESTRVTVMDCVSTIENSSRGKHLKELCDRGAAVAYKYEKLPLRLNVLDITCASDREVVAAETLMQMALKNTSPFQIRLRDIASTLDTNNTLSLAASMDPVGLAHLHLLRGAMSESVANKKGITIASSEFGNRLKVAEYRVTETATLSDLQAISAIREWVAAGSRGPGRGGAGMQEDEDGDRAHEFWLVVTSTEIRAPVPSSTDGQAGKGASKGSGVAAPVKETVRGSLFVGRVVRPPHCEIKSKNRNFCPVCTRNADAVV